eukprot:3779249-Amphidinium_carterae.1
MAEVADLRRECQTVAQLTNFPSSQLTWPANLEDFHPPVRPRSENHGTSYLMVLFVRMSLRSSTLGVH